MGRSKRGDTFTGMTLHPVPPDESGEGLPYAPENWPQQGDIWGWKTGKRLHNNGCFQDRYLYSPSRLSTQKGGSSRKHRHIFASKLSVERYIKATFPDSDIDAFFSSFSWRIPSLNASNGCNMVPIAAVPLQQIPLIIESDSDDSKTDVVRCKARNKKCDSLKLDVVEKHSPAMPCDICCSESGFCRDCSCILCCKTVNSTLGGYSYIKCGVNVGEGICGHVAHVECALRSLLAGTVGKSFGLDTEYHCRRCDGRTDLVSHVERLVEICKAVDLNDEIKKKVLDLGACLLRGSKKPVAKELFNRVELAIAKLKCVSNGEDIKMDDDNHMVHSEGLPDHGTDPMEVTMNGSPSNVRSKEEAYDYRSHSLKFEADIDDVMETLRKSQELECKVVEERLRAQQIYLQGLYDQIDREMAELECPNLTHSEPLFRAIRERKEQIRQELAKYEDMKKVASGFSRTSNDISKEIFNN